MDRYTKVDQKKPNIPINENEIRITSQGLVRNYISYATTRIQERRGKEIVLKAMGQAISKTVAIAEFLKRNIPRLHQDTAISSISITDIWEPIEEGLLPVEMTRQVSMIFITLSTKELNTNSPGYQAPVYVERSKPHYNSYQRQQPRQAHQSYNEEPYSGNYRGRGQGGGGVRGRGWNNMYGGYQSGDGYRNYQGDNEYGGNNYQGGSRGYGNGNNYQGGGRGYGNGNNYQGGVRGYGNGNYFGGGRGYGNGNYRGGRGYGNYQGGGGEYGNNYQGGGEYRNYQDNNGYSNRGRGGGRGGNAGYRGGGYMRGGGGSRGGGLNGRGGRGRMGGAE
ncbi:uncharacterized protein LOC143590817 isoform X1 [Bidens hawaiensis]|uniref:uncharacterized protein LOC143590817 isoform X1 n=1 Tax=Bidens hawaiensis TaxID=980011 RepID=UPI00404AFB4A